MSDFFHPETVPATEAAPESEEPAVDLGLLEELASALADVQGALDRLDSGAYGTCEVCGSPIPDALLEESPTAKKCAAHAEGARVESHGWAAGAAVRSDQ